MSTTEVSREELFALVWSQPVSQVAKAMGVSELAVAKMCASLQVPKPPRGYWTRRAAGRKPRLPPLDAFREHAGQVRSGRFRTVGSGIDLSVIQRRFVEKALRELDAKGVDLAGSYLGANQLRDAPPGVVAQVLLLIQHDYLGWIRRNEVEVQFNRQVRRTLESLVDKLLPVAGAQVLLFQTERKAKWPEASEPLLLVRLTSHLQLRIAELARIVREQKLAHVVMPLTVHDHAWSAHHVHASETCTYAQTVLCVSAEEAWAECTVVTPHYGGERQDSFLTSRLLLRSIMPIDGKRCARALQGLNRHGMS